MARVLPFESAHLRAAAALVAADAAEARRRYDLPPPGLGPPARVPGLLAPVAESGLGAVALEGRRLVGLLAPLTLELWGGPAAYVPEWGQGAVRADLVAPLYAAASARWVAAGRRIHAVTVRAERPDLEAAWHDLGFGRMVVDAVRGLAPVGGARGRATGVGIREAGPRDASTLAALERALWEHLAAPPAFRVHPAPGGRAEAARRLADPARPVWLAESDGAAAGFLSLAPAEAVAASLRSPDLVYCDNAFVAAGWRGKGVGRVLLAAGLKWAAAAGFRGCLVDYESANPSALRFWGGAGFRPVLHSLGRRLA